MEGRTLFLVDKIHTDRWDTNQRRQRVEAANLINSQSEKEFDLYEEEVHSTKSRWTWFSDCNNPNWAHAPLLSRDLWMRSYEMRRPRIPEKKEFRQRPDKISGKAGSLSVPTAVSAVGSPAFESVRGRYATW